MVRVLFPQRCGGTIHNVGHTHNVPVSYTHLAILFSNINALFVQAVRVDDFKQMLHKLCNTGTFLIKDHFKDVYKRQST